MRFHLKFFFQLIIEYLIDNKTLIDFCYLLPSTYYYTYPLFRMPVQVTTTGNASSSSSSSNNNNNRQHQFISQAGDSGHETLLSDDDSPTPTVERASSEVIYSTISNG